MNHVSYLSIFNNGMSDLSADFVTDITVSGIDPENWLI
jgi:hypothetical protein